LTPSRCSLSLLLASSLISLVLDGRWRYRVRINQEGKLCGRYGRRDGDLASLSW